MNPKERFLAAVSNRETDRPPVWLMRQAGRYLPEYRAIKADHPTKEMMSTPQIACDITLQPVHLVGVDAAILYSDILMIPDAMGMGLAFATGEGPTFAFPIDGEANFNRLHTRNVNERLGFVFETVKLCAQALPKDFPLIGFAGAPFTVACYMIAGKASSGFPEAKRLAWEQPKVFHALLNALSLATIDYLSAQVDAGACVVQLFDTWAGLLSPADYREFAKPYVLRVFSELKKRGVPTIYYAKAGDYLLPDLNDLPCDTLGVDWRTDLATVKARTGNKFGIQGNFDPDLLLTTPQIISERVNAMFMAIGNPRRGYIANLGHGVSQHTPVAHVKHFVEQAKKAGLAKVS